ncbi:4-hydroxyphenylacetate 3-hydroxylase N-terminal domain-containing protein [Ramlibacter sp.]|uniref:4-hydroxyphenylacetate 3-hydroxylase N-terminal domain-containing protein n=1 Tax=Ramlibacter sp. TaxID=1917967 RepID=UPI003D11ABD4
MALRTGEEYIASLRDDRVVYYAGERVKDVTTHPYISLRARENARQFGLGAKESPERLDLRTVLLPDGERVHRWALPCRTREDLLKFVEMEETMEGDAHGAMTAGLTALKILGRKMDAKFGTAYTPRIEKYADWFARQDLHGSFAMTDAKGDRSKSPSQQVDPDLWVRVVERRPDGIVISGAKTSVSSAPVCNELLVLPTHAMGPADKDWSVACAVPANAPGVTMICNYIGSPWGERHRFDRPVHFNDSTPDATVIFDKVFVPNDRVFMDGEFEYTREMIGYFSTFHRAGILVNEPRETKKLIGAAQLMARYNGIDGVGNIRNGIGEMVQTVQMLDVLRHTALSRVQFVEGVCVPDAVACNLAGLTVTSARPGFLTFLCELAGGPVLTAPSGLDLANPETSALVKKYYVGKEGVSGEDRLRLIKYIYDIAASDSAAYSVALGVTAAGSPSARRVAVARGFDVEACVNTVKQELQ